MDQSRATTPDASEDAPDEIAFRELSKPSPTRPYELREVRKLAQELRAFLNRPSTLGDLHTSHVVGKSSAAVQSILLPEAERLGFQSERRGLFASCASNGVRPDYFRVIGQSGILIEVERGKTLDNNMDLLDLWKCHLCPIADYLFLVVPKRRPTKKGASRVMFARVCHRLEAFFTVPNLVNVEAVFLFGY
jgi:hypothetical protein